MRTTDDYRIGIKFVNRRNLKTSNTKLNYVWRHGSVVSATYATWRSILIEGYIIANTRSWLSKGMDWLDIVFSIQTITWWWDLYSFIGVDEQGRSWECMAGPDEAITYDIDEDDDHNDWSTRRFLATIFSPDPKLYSPTASTATWVEWFIGLFSIGLDGFPIWLDGFSIFDMENFITTIALSNDTPMVFTITATADVSSPICIYNITDNKAFYINTTAISWDVIIVDGKNYTITKNWSDITALRVPGSIRPNANWITEFIVINWLDGGSLTWWDFNVSISYKNHIL